MFREHVPAGTVPRTSVNARLHALSRVFRWQKKNLVSIVAFVKQTCLSIMFGITNFSDAENRICAYMFPRTAVQKLCCL